MKHSSRTSSYKRREKFVLVFYPRLVSFIDFLTLPDGSRRILETSEGDLDKLYTRTRRVPDEMPFNQVCRITLQVSRLLTGKLEDGTIYSTNAAKISTH
jgi:hypothetical protein